MGYSYHANQRLVAELGYDVWYNVVLDVMGAWAEGNYVCVQAQDDERVYPPEPYLYGVYVESPEWVNNYERSGGAWGYIPPDQWLVM